MLVSRRWLHQLFALACDLVGLGCAWYIVVLLITVHRPSVPDMSSESNTWWFLLFAVLVSWVPNALSQKLYARSRLEPGGELLFVAIQSIVLVTSVSVIVAILVTNLRIDIARKFIFRFVPISVITVCLARNLRSRIVRYASAKWPRRPAVALVAERVDSGFFDRLRNVHPAVLKGIIVPASAVSEVVSQSLPVLGTTRDLAAVINRERLDGIILLNGAISDPDVRACNMISRRMGVTMGWALPLPESTYNVSVAYGFGMPLLEMVPVSFTRGERSIKRLFDLLISSVLIAMLLPAMILIGFLVKVSSKGPILYRAPRVGRGGRYFTFLKFRTMCTDLDRNALKVANGKDGHIFKMRYDPRVTSVGRFLRRYSLDELPQLFNVLLGDMSLVGPRPLPAEDLDPDGLSSQFAAWSEQRATVPPGITGLWQIRGRSDLPFTDLIRYDLEYVHNWSLLLDLKILLQTPYLVLSGRGAY